MWRLIRLDVLVDPQHVAGIILFLGLYQAGVVRTVCCPDQSLARFAQLVGVHSLGKWLQLVAKILDPMHALIFPDGSSHRPMMSNSKPGCRKGNAVSLVPTRVTAPDSATMNTLVFGGALSAVVCWMNCLREVRAISFHVSLFCDSTVWQGGRPGTHDTRNQKHLRSSGVPKQSAPTPSPIR